MGEQSAAFGSKDLRIFPFKGFLKKAPDRQAQAGSRFPSEPNPQSIPRPAHVEVVKARLESLPLFKGATLTVVEEMPGRGKLNLKILFTRPGDWEAYSRERSGAEAGISEVLHKLLPDVLPPELVISTRVEATDNVKRSIRKEPPVLAFEVDHPFEYTPRHRAYGWRRELPWDPEEGGE